MPVCSARCSSSRPRSRVSRLGWRSSPPWRPNTSSRLRILTRSIPFRLRSARDRPARSPFLSSSSSRERVRECGFGQRHVRPLGRDQPGRHRHGSRLVPRKGMASPDASITTSWSQALRRLSDDHARTVMLARTLLQPAPPITFGLKVAGWFAALDRSWTRLSSVAGRGADPAVRWRSRHAGGLGGDGLAVSAELARELDLVNPERALAHAARSARHARRGVRRLHRDARQDRARRRSC